MASTLPCKTRKITKAALVTGFTLVLLLLFLSPFGFMVFTSLKTPEQISIVGTPIWPAAVAKYAYNGKQVDMYTVPMNTCTGSENDTGTKGLALVKKGTRQSTFVDPKNLERGEFVCKVSWRALDRPWKFSPTFSNFKEMGVDQLPAPAGEHPFYAIMSTIGVLISCTLVAYGFSRFDFPARDFLFIVLIATIFLPAFVTVIPTYTSFSASAGWAPGCR